MVLKSAHSQQSHADDDNEEALLSPRSPTSRGCIKVLWSSKSLLPRHLLRPRRRLFWWRPEDDPSESFYYPSSARRGWDDNSSSAAAAAGGALTEATLGKFLLLLGMSVPKVCHCPDCFWHGKWPFEWLCSRCRDILWARATPALFPRTESPVPPVVPFEDESYNNSLAAGGRGTGSERRHGRVNKWPAVYLFSFGASHSNIINSFSDGAK